MFSKVSPQEQIVLAAFRGRPRLVAPDLPISGKEYRAAVKSLVQRGWLKSTRLPLLLTNSVSLKKYMSGE